MNLVASTILNQVGRVACSDIGARDYTSTDEGVQFRVGKGPLKKLCIILNGRDLYDVKLYKQGPAPSFKGSWVVDEHDIYAEDLSRVVVDAVSRGS